ncbi:hypothetical protein [Flavobacterium phragmitis]|uniref:Uncharacterized protein n=1 Tax=Flavobacterium phragmitis TaxID=739143 RepID=A0A1I1T1E7_9FLAO|nr:hypothetical protein [Flavobacterium phragmitis]SFD49100.1 hypothetical protein SAMN05216297_108180 [Flavobacterium phragmitis]
MCENVKEIKLCTCIINDNDTVISHKRFTKYKSKKRNDYIWVLERYVGYANTTMDGMIIFPLDTLNESLSTKKMLEELNSRNCFDFEYNPSEGDNLEIFAPGSYDRKLSFIYRNEEWTADHYNGFLHETEKINFGRVTFD